ncbi:MAG: hypothetical protein LYZ69_08345 [Nitrososphaerales archaeon]|nr:hypothetical protein [Nitrososphaerales archaeon]
MESEVVEVGAGALGVTTAYWLSEFFECSAAPVDKDNAAAPASAAGCEVKGLRWRTPRELDLGSRREKSRSRRGPASSANLGSGFDVFEVALRQLRDGLTLEHMSNCTLDLSEPSRTNGSWILSAPEFIVAEFIRYYEDYY